MKNKFKCWKKETFSDGTFKYVNKNRKGTLYIFDGKIVNIAIDTVKFGNTEITKTHINEQFKTKPQAEKFAMRYMKKHDKC